MSYLQKVRQPITAIAPIDPERMYETANAARVISCSVHTITDLCQQGDVKFERNGRKYLIKGSELLLLIKKDQMMRAQRAAEQAAEKERSAQKATVKEEAIDVGQMDMLDPAPRTFRINLSPKVYMRLRKAARKMNTPISELASMILNAGLDGREQE